MDTLKTAAPEGHDGNQEPAKTGDHFGKELQYRKGIKYGIQEGRYAEDDPPSNQIDGIHSNSDSDSAEDLADAMDSPPRKHRAPHNSKPRHPSHLSFYTGTWHDVLVKAKDKYRLHVHTTVGFPSKSEETL